MRSAVAAASTVSGSESEPAWLRVLRIPASVAGSSKVRCCTPALDAVSVESGADAVSGWLAEGAAAEVVGPAPGVEAPVTIAKDPEAAATDPAPSAGVGGVRAPVALLPPALDPTSLVEGPGPRLAVGAPLASPLATACEV